MNQSRCYAKSIEIANELRKDNSLFVCDPHEAITTYSSYFTILPAGVTLYTDDNGRGRINWNGIDNRWSLEVRVSDHKKGHSLDFTPGASVAVAVARIQKHITKERQ